MGTIHNQKFYTSLERTFRACKFFFKFGGYAFRLKTLSSSWLLK